MLVLVEFHTNILPLFVAYLHFFSYICCLSVARFRCPQYRATKKRNDATYSYKLQHSATTGNNEQ
jgi:hypothetical protein